MSVRAKEDGSIEIDNTDLLRGRADMSDEPGEQKLHTDELGGMETSGEAELQKNKKRTEWSEPTHKATDVKHVCSICGTRYWGRPNKAYCTTRCKEVAKKRRSRKRKRDIRDFKPHRGKAGEVYFMYDNKGKEGIAYVPAFHADTRARAKKYIDDTYPVGVRDAYFEQVKEVIRK